MKKRKDGRYCKQILVGYKENGTRILKTIYGKTIKEVEAKEREVRNNIDNGVNMLQGEMSLETWARKWLSIYKNNVERSTYKMYEDSINNYIIPTIGDIQLSKLKPMHIQEAVNDILANKLTRTAEIYRLTIKQIINQAVSEGLISKNICTNLDKIKSTRMEKRVLTDFELRCISKTQYTDKERLFVDILYYTGVRRGEALALTRHDIDVENRILRINKSLDISENTPIIKQPKTSAGIRDIPIPNILFSELLEYFLNHHDIYLFAMMNGNPPTRSSFRKMWKSIMSKTKETADDMQKEELLYGLAPVNDISFTPHIFRHTYATNLYNADIDIKRCQYLLGHSSLEMTLKIYTHLENKKYSETADKINAFFKCG